jgi:hypothetical protein
LLAAETESIQLEPASYNRAQEVMRLGFKPLDAMHVACAEAARCDVLRTTDDAVLKRAAKSRPMLMVDIRNPLDWLLEQQK